MDLHRELETSLAVGEISRTKKLEVRIDRLERAEAANSLLDLMMTTYGLKNDAALARFLRIGRPHLCKVRYGVNKVGADMIIRIHEMTDWSIADIKQKLGMPAAAAQ